MTKHLQSQSIFEQIKQFDTEGNEFWTARTLAKMKELGLIRDNGEDPNSPNYKYKAT